MNFRIHHKPVTASTNQDARAGAHGDVYTADAQTAGRGRLDYRWLSAPGANLMLSAVFDVAGLASEQVATFPLVVGTQRVGNSKGQQLYFLDTENCHIFASAEGEG